MNYGLNGDNLPSPSQVVDLYLRCNISFIRIFEPRHEVLDALRGKPLLLSLGTRNEDIEIIAQDQNAANGWVNDNVVPYIEDVNFEYITVGNEVIPGPEAAFVAPAIQNIKRALDNAGITKCIRVTTVIHGGSLANSYPPSAGAFSDEAATALGAIAPILVQNGHPMMINVYPYFAYAANPGQISLDYALFRSDTPVVHDGDYEYFNLFDAMVDAFNAAFEKIGVNNLVLDVAETGWPSAGNEPHTSIENALAYNKNLINRVQSGKGTPRRPSQCFYTFIFEMFNEDEKSAGVEQNFGSFYPDMTPVYPLWS